MNKLIRIYNQNRGLVIAVVCIIALIIIIIQVLNSIVKKQNIEKAKLITNDTNSSADSSTTMFLNNKSVITGNETKTNISDRKIIEEFVKACNDKDIDTAYNLLSNDCRERIYPNIQNFKTLYVDRIFSIDRMYSLENWFDTNSLKTYYIKYTEDVMASGSLNSNSNMSDYITVTSDGKLNINSFVGSKEINKKQTQNDITISISKIYLYMDYLIADVKVQNNSKNVISIDTKDRVDNTYLYDTNGIKYLAFLNENSEESLKVRSGGEQSVEIKFNKIYNPTSRTLKRIKIKRCNFKL